MSRRDTIIIAVLVNTCLLAILFMTAVHIDEDHIQDRFSMQQEVVLHEEESEQSVQRVVSQPTPETYVVSDEIDRVLQDYTPQVKTAYKEPQQVSGVKEAYVPKQQTIDREELVSNIVEVTVKRGDSLGKIAQNNNTTIAAIKRENHLPSERIVIGQTLLVPVNIKAVSKVKEKPVIPQENEFYTIKVGDNPWKIAKLYHVRFDELLEMNNLDEQKARNLKAGDKLRVR